LVLSYIGQTKNQFICRGYQHPQSRLPGVCIEARPWEHAGTADLEKASSNKSLAKGELTQLVSMAYLF
jgi:hypothetical protein